MSEILDTKYVNVVNPDLDSSTDGDASAMSLLDAHGDSDSRNAAMLIRIGPRYYASSSQYLRDVVHVHPLSGASEIIKPH